MYKLALETPSKIIFNTIGHRQILLFTRIFQKFSKKKKKKTFSNISSKNFFSAKKIRENETTFRLKLTTSYQENSLSRGGRGPSTSSNCLCPHPRAERASASTMHEHRCRYIAGTMKGWLVRHNWPANSPRCLLIKE